TPHRTVEHPPRRIAFAGAVHRHKGALEFESVVRRLEAQQPGRYRWHVFGGGDPALLGRLRRLPRTRVHGYFRAGSLPARLVAAEIDLVLLPSIWPEAHCLVLDECAAAGVPVVAFALGALGERVLAGGLGEVVDPGAGADGLADRIASLG
ncbi:MAG: glycosyltransferase, partial [Thermoanaerobaculia bacterium]|nr:glycosyltransferase [Thermoanaerobaculia bacterium]